MSEQSLFRSRTNCTTDTYTDYTVAIYTDTQHICSHTQHALSMTAGV